MNEETLTITLPNTIYDRVKITAQATALTSEEVIKQSISLLLPAFESNISTSSRLKLSKFSLLSDVELWKKANSIMGSANQSRLEELAQLQKEKPLKKDEQTELDNLMAKAQRIMLSKAEARRVLAQRGHVVFKSYEL